MEEIRKLLWEDKYKECLGACKKKLNEDPNNARAWYYMFLSDNQNFTEPLECFNNEIAYEKALELSENEDKEYFEDSHVMMNELKDVPALSNLYLAISDGQTEKIISGFRKVLEDKSVSERKLSSSFTGVAMDLMTRKNAELNLYQMFFYFVSVHFMDVKFRRIYDNVVSAKVTADTVKKILEEYENHKSSQLIQKKDEEKKNGILKVGDIFEFGTYAGEKISWRVLELNDDKALILTDKIIEVKRFDSSRNNYENSEIRKWLNDRFYKTFTSDEKNRIQKTQVNNGLETAMDGINPYICHNTEDYIFFLSVEEANKYFKNDAERKCKSTNHANGNGLCVTKPNGYSFWWLRSPLPDDNYIARLVCNYGVICYDNVNFYDIGVRPACWIKL